MGHRTKLSKKKIDKLRSRYVDDHASLNELSKEFNIALKTAWRYLRDSGVIMRSRGNNNGSSRPHRKVNINDLRTILYLYNDRRLSISEIVDETKFSRSTILRQLKKHNAFKGIYQNIPRSKAIAEAYLKGGNLKKVARDFNLSESGVYYHLRKMGYEPNRNHRRNT